MLQQSGLLGGTGTLDAQTIAALAAAGIQPNVLGMLGIQPELLGMQTTSIPGLPAGISPAAMLQALQVRSFCKI